MNLYQLAHWGDEVIASEMQVDSVHVRHWTTRTTDEQFDMLSAKHSPEPPVDCHTDMNEFRMHLLFVRWATTKE